MGEVFAGRYELVDLIGQGGMGAVWRVWDHRHGGYLAAKVLRQSNASALLRFVREQGLRIPHPHVVAPRSWAAEDERVLFTMDLVAGGSVATLVGDHGALPPAYVACLLDQVLDGLEAIHQAGVIHRDLKPANLLLDATGDGRPHVRVSDFGISVRIGEPRLTETSHLVGTPGYLAPEQLHGADPSPLQDLYGLGVIAVELVVGHRPERTPLGLPVMPTAAPDGMDPRLWSLLTALTAQDPADRPSTAAAAREALASLDVLPRTDPSGRRRVDGGPLPWQVGADPLEVFDQLPPLPDGWGEEGPRRSNGMAGAGGVPGPAGLAGAGGVAGAGVAGATAAAATGPPDTATTAQVTGRAAPPSVAQPGPTQPGPTQPGPTQPGPTQPGSQGARPQYAGQPPQPQSAHPQAAQAQPQATRPDITRSAYAAPGQPPTVAAMPPDASPQPERRRGRRVGLLIASGVLLLGALGVGGFVVVPSVLDLLGGGEAPTDGSRQRDSPASGRTAVEVGSKCSFTDVAVVERDARGRVLGCTPGEDGYSWQPR